MKAVNLFVTGVILTLGLTACGAVKDAKNAGNMKTEGDNIATAINTEKMSLAWEGIDTGTPDSQKDMKWNSKTPEKRAELRERLNKLRLLLTRYTEIAAHKDLEKNNGSQKASGSRNLMGAKMYINSLDKSEGKPQSFPEFKV